MRTLLAFAAFVAALPAQDKPGPTSFFPPEYQAEFFADVAAVRANGLLEAVQRSLASVILRQLELQSMAKIDDLERIRFVIRIDPGEDEANERLGNRRRVLVAEGKAVTADRLDVKPPYPFGTFEATTVAGHAVHVWSASEEWQEAFVSPRPGFVVAGARAWVESILDGSAKGGVAHPELLALMAARGVLAQFAMARCGLPPAAWSRDLPAPREWIDPNDPPEGFCFRLVEAEGVIQLQVRVPFARDGAGVKLLEEKVRAGLAMAKKDRKLGAFKKLWNAIELTRDGAELQARVVMGPPERASAMLAQTMLPLAASLFALRAVEAEAVAAEVVLDDLQVAPQPADPAPAPQSQPTSRPDRDRSPR